MLIALVKGIHEEGTLLRKMVCWHSFVGNAGRGKNMALFYCFIIWEGHNTRWGSERRLVYLLRRQQLVVLPLVFLLRRSLSERT